MGCETKRKGDVTEAVVLAELVKLGFVVMIPFGDNQPYDIVVDNGGKFSRLQCKTGRVRDGVVVFNTESCLPRADGKIVSRSYVGEVDYFAIYCREINKIYLVPIGQACKGKCSLRLEPAKNNQAEGVRLASSFELKIESFSACSSSG